MYNTPGPAVSLSPRQRPPSVAFMYFPGRPTPTSAPGPSHPAPAAERFAGEGWRFTRTARATASRPRNLYFTRQPGNGCPSARRAGFSVLRRRRVLCLLRCSANGSKSAMAGARTHRAGRCPRRPNEPRAAFRAVTRLSTAGILHGSAQAHHERGASALLGRQATRTDLVWQRLHPACACWHESILPVDDNSVKSE